MRIYNQAIETIKKTNAKPGDIIIPLHYRKISDGICSTLTTRPEELKTMILIIEENNKMNNPNKDIKPKLVGGFGEKKYNGGTQWYQHDRVYDSRAISMCLQASLLGGGYWYLVEEDKK